MLFNEPPEFWVLSGLQHCTLFFFPVDKVILETKRFPHMSHGDCNKLIQSPTTLPQLAGDVSLLVAVAVVGGIVVVVKVEVVWLI